MTERNRRFTQHAFIFRCWRDSTESTWRFALENSEHRLTFASLAELHAFLQATFPDEHDGMDNPKER